MSFAVVAILRSSIPYQTECLASGNGEAYAIDRFYRAYRLVDDNTFDDGKVFLEVLDLE